MPFRHRGLTWRRSTRSPPSASRASRGHRELDDESSARIRFLCTAQSEPCGSYQAQRRERPPCERDVPAKVESSEQPGDAWRYRTVKADFGIDTENDEMISATRPDCGRAPSCLGLPILLFDCLRHVRKCTSKPLITVRAARNSTLRRADRWRRICETNSGWLILAAI